MTNFNPGVGDQFRVNSRPYEMTETVNQSFYTGMNRSVYLVNQTISEIGSLEGTWLVSDADTNEFHTRVPIAADAAESGNGQPDELKTDKVELVFGTLSEQVATVNFFDESRVSNNYGDF